MKLVLANDTSTVPHAGCQAVSAAHRLMLRKLGATVIAVHHVNEDLHAPARLVGRMTPALEHCDALVVNGEGTIHDGRGAHLAALIEAAQGMEKRTYLVNCVLDNLPDQWAGLLVKLDDLTVREPRSAEEAKRLGGRPRIVPDSCLEAGYRPQITWVGWPARSVVVGDSTLPGAQEELDRYAKDTDAPRWYVQDTARFLDWSNWGAVLAGSVCYVTGRHHGIYLAALAGVPIVAMRSNTHKIESLLEWVGEGIPIVQSAKEIPEAVEQTRANPGAVMELRKRLLARTPLTTFAGLKDA